jgi:hypothetical protein
VARTEYVFFFRMSMDLGASCNMTTVIPILALEKDTLSEPFGGESTRLLYLDCHIGGHGDEVPYSIAVATRLCGTLTQQLEPVCPEPIHLAERQRQVTTMVLSVA